MGPVAGIEPAAGDPQSPMLPLHHTGHRLFPTRNEVTHDGFNLLAYPWSHACGCDDLKVILQLPCPSDFFESIQEVLSKDATSQGIAKPIRYWVRRVCTEKREFRKKPDEEIFFKFASKSCCQSMSLLIDTLRTCCERQG